MFYQIGAVSCYFLYSLYKSIDFDIFLEELNKIFFFSRRKLHKTIKLLHTVFAFCALLASGYACGI